MRPYLLLAICYLWLGFAAAAGGGEAGHHSDHAEKPSDLEDGSLPEGRGDRRAPPKHTRAESASKHGDHGGELSDAGDSLHGDGHGVKDLGVASGHADDHGDHGHGEHAEHAEEYSVAGYCDPEDLHEPVGDSHAEARLLSGGAWATPFVLPFRLIIASDRLWFMMVGMIVFMCAVDRLQYLTTLWTDTDYCRKLFIDRVNAELVMFGIVSISLFLFESIIYQMQVNEMYQFHYTDLICSIGACTLIFYGGFLMAFISKVTRHYMVFKKRAIDDAGLEIYSMAAYFLSQTVVEPGFDFGMYMKESLAQAICDLICLDYKPWLAMLAPAGAMYALTLSMDISQAHAEQLICGFAVSCYVTLIVAIIFALVMRRTRNRLRHCLGVHDIEKIRAEVADYRSVNLGDMPHPSGEFATKLQSVARQLTDPVAKPDTSHTWLIAYGLQVLALLTTMMLSFYLCHFMHNIIVYCLPGWWHAVCVCPLALQYFMLPGIVSDVAVVEAVLTPNAEVLDRVVESIRVVEQDRLHVYSQLENAASVGKLDVAELEKKIKADGTIGWLKEFQSYTAKLNVHMSRKRMHRVLLEIDFSNARELTASEFFNWVDPELVAKLKRAK